MILETADTLINEVKEAARSNRIIIGPREILKAIETKKIDFIVASRNCNSSIYSKIKEASSSMKIPLHKFELSNASLGELCGKPFGVSFVATVKPKEEEEIIDF